MRYFADISDYTSKNFASTSDFTLWDSLHEYLTILEEIFCRNVWLYFMRYFVVIFDLYYMRYLAETTDYTAWYALQEHLIVLHDTSKKHLIILYGKLCRNLSLYFMRKFTKTSDYTLWGTLKKHLDYTS